MNNIRIPDSEFKERVVKVQKKMAETGYDMLLCYGNEAEPQFVRYFSDYWPSFVGIAWIEDCGINAGKSCRHLEVEDRNLLSLCLIDRAIEDSVDDTTCILDRDTLASTVPTCIYEVSGSARLLHTLNELLTILCWVE